MDVGFLGLGSMGAPMAARLVEAGHAVTVWNRTAARAQRLVDAGAVLADAPSRAAAAGVAITMLADDDAVEAAVLGEDGLLAALPSGGLHLSMSTISLSLAERLAALHAERGQHFVSAPVFGRPPAAAAGKLFVVAAGAADQIERARPLFEAMGQKLFVVGDVPRAANLVKLCGNFMILSTVELLSEAMTLASRGGVAKKDLLEVLTGTVFSAPVYSIYGGLMVEEAFRPAGFAAPLAAKDLRLVEAAAQSLGAPMDVLGIVQNHMADLIELEGDDIDCSALIKAVERSALP